MKRKIELAAGDIHITATINTKAKSLSRAEVEKVRDELADNLLRAVADVRYIGVPINRVRVR